MKIVINLLLVVTFLGFAGNASPDPRSLEKTVDPLASSRLAAAEPAATGPASGTVKGTVLETIDAAGYTYMRLKTSKGEIWAAVTKAVVKKGSEVTVVNATPMDGFESLTLKRKFDRIVFGNLAAEDSGASGFSPLAPGHGAAPEKQSSVAAQHAGVGSAPAETGGIKVKKAEGEEGKTVAEVFAARASLKDAPVAVRGKVVKYNPGIMGKNWVHLRDGSGSSEKKDNDITVTTQDSAAVGDIILVRGTLRLNRDFGSGYSYPAIIEDAKVSK